MNDLQLFNFENQQVRTIVISNEPYFVGKDVAKILGYSKPANAIHNHVEADDKGVTKMMTPGGEQAIQVINESGLYSLILSSKMPNAKRFKHWVTSKVLPAIRKHGAYMTDQKAFDIVHNKNGLADLLQQAANQLKQKDIQIEKMKPKALFADSVSASDTTVIVRTLSKVLKGNGIDIGEKRLFKWLRKNGYLIKQKGSDWNMPTQKAMDLGLFKIHYTVVDQGAGAPKTRKTPRVTGKGQQYFVNKFLAMNKEHTESL